MIVGSRAIFSIPIARSTSSHRWPVTANATLLAATRNSWPALADVGRGFTRSLAHLTGFDPTPANRERQLTGTDFCQNSGTGRVQQANLRSIRRCSTL